MKTLFRIALLILLAPIAWFSLLMALDQRRIQNAAATPHHETTVAELAAKPSAPCDPTTAGLPSDLRLIIEGHPCISHPAPCRSDVAALPREEQMLQTGHVCTNR